MGKVLIGFLIGWVVRSRYTHIMIASECEKLGGFFVGSKTYKCVVIENNSIAQTTILETEKLNRLE